jgi:hypothetical protein
MLEKLTNKKPHTKNHGGVRHKYKRLLSLISKHLAYTRKTPQNQGIVKLKLAFRKAVKPLSLEGRRVGVRVMLNVYYEFK